MYNINNVVVALDAVIFAIVFLILIIFNVIPKGETKEEQRKSFQLRVRVASALLTVFFTILVLALIGIFGPKG